ncbi:MAG: hypothetical protein DLM52_04535 [Chthoniobacterales bacterium]|nr:MAG: hypothetical protein DLM52_04535 [Chthoniobacterales bacterium]
MARAWSHGECPLLSPYSWVCGNLAGEFQYGTFSIFVNALVVLIWKLPLFFSQQAAALSIAHIAVLSAGAFLLARDRKLSLASSILVALIASLNGWIICWGASDWFGALAAFTWLPWAWWGAERALDQTRTLWRFLWPAPFVYLLVTGGFPYTVLMLLLVFAWLAVRDVVSTRELTTIVPLIVGTALGFGLAAPAWLALLDYVHGSARETLQPSSHFQWLVPWNAWPALVLPSWTVNWPDFSSRMAPHAGTELNCGLVPVPVMLAALLTKPRAFLRRTKWELVLLAVVAALAMIPTAGVFRWSFRWLPLFHLVLALCAAEALRLTGRDTEDAKDREAKATTNSSVSSVVHLPAGIALVTGIILVVAAWMFGFDGQDLFPLSWTLLALSIAWLLSGYTRRLREWSPAAIAFLALLATYLSIPTNCGVPRYNFAQSLRDPAPLDPQRLYISFYPEPEHAYRTEAHPQSVGQIVRPGSTPMWAALRFVNGYSPIRPAGVAREFATAIHGEIDPNTGEWLAWSEAHAGGLLERLGVDGMIVAREFDFAPLPESDWRLVFQNAEGRVYHRGGEPLARVRSVGGDGKHVVAQVVNIDDQRNSLQLHVDVPPGHEPALLAFARPYFSGYRATLNGRELPVTTARNLTPLVEVPAGSRGRLTLSYRPAWLIYGGAIAAISGFFWIACATFATLAMCGRMRERYAS